MRRIALLTILVIVTALFAGCGEEDETAPEISAVSASDITETSAAITWTTDEKATSQVEYGTTAAYGSTTTLDTTLVKSHSVSLSGLTAGTTYHYRVISADDSDNEAKSTDKTFTTTGTAAEGLQPGSEWTYEVSFMEYEDWLLGEGTEVTTWTYTLDAVNVMPEDLSPCDPASAALVSNRLLIDHCFGGACAVRQPTNCPAAITFFNGTFWVSSDSDDGMLGQVHYCLWEGDIGFGYLKQEWEYRNFTLSSGANIGEPYAVGNSWRYDEFSCAQVNMECLSSWDWPWFAEVVAANVTVTVPAGTFDDCFQIDHYCDWNLDGEFTQGNASVSELTRSEWYSPTAMAKVKWYDYLTFDGPPGGQSGPQIGPPPEFVEVYELTSYDLILT